MFAISDYLLERLQGLFNRPKVNKHIEDFLQRIATKAEMSDMEVRACIYQLCEEIAYCRDRYHYVPPIAYRVLNQFNQSLHRLESSSMQKIAVSF